MKGGERGGERNCLATRHRKLLLTATDCNCLANWGSKQKLSQKNGDRDIVNLYCKREGSVYIEKDKGK